MEAKQEFGVREVAAVAIGWLTGVALLCLYTLCLVRFYEQHHAQMRSMVGGGALLAMCPVLVARVCRSGSITLILMAIGSLIAGLWLVGLPAVSFALAELLFVQMCVHAGEESYRCVLLAAGGNVYGYGTGRSA